jgi:dipeptidyl aminopeptidase/acylaminoacyl peptidase
MNEDLNNASFRIDSSRLAVSGASAGAYPAYLAAVHALPKPRAVFGLYGLGGHLLTSFYYSIKSPITVNIADYESYLNPIDEKNNFVRSVSDIPLAWPILEGGEKARTTGALYQVFSETGTLLDYLRGVQRLSQCLRSTTPYQQNLQEKIPEESQCLFPELYVANFPPTYLVHGTADQAVPTDNSTFLAQKLELNHIPYVLTLAEGRGHGFNAEADAEEIYNTYIKGVIQFFLEHV